MRFRLKLFIAIGAILLGAGLSSAPADAQRQGKRASVQEVTKAVRGESQKEFGPTNLPRPPETEDGREYVYLEVIFVTAIRDRRPARTYSFWPRLTMSKDAPSDAYWRGLPRVRDAMTLALAEVTQIDWPGPTQLDAALASRLAQKRADAAMGGGVVDEIEFLHIEVQNY